VFDLPDSPSANFTNSSRLLAPVEIIDVMIDLRIQMSELEQQIQSLQPAFFAACLALNTDKIALERAIITRTLYTWAVDIFSRYRRTRSPVQTVETAISATSRTD
jgi:hypothetical protein